MPLHLRLRGWAAFLCLYRRKAVVRFCKIVYDENKLLMRKYEECGGKNMEFALFFLLPLVLGIVFLVCAIIVKVVFEKKKERCTQMVEARIVDIHKMERRDGGDVTSAYVSYFPIYEYEYKGKIYQRSSNVGNLKSAFEIGKKVIIYIDPQNPETLYEDSKVPKLIVPIFGAVGVLLLLISVIVKIFAFS